MAKRAQRSRRRKQHGGAIVEWTVTIIDKNGLEFTQTVDRDESKGDELAGEWEQYARAHDLFDDEHTLYHDIDDSNYRIEIGIGEPNSNNNNSNYGNNNNNNNSEAGFEEALAYAYNHPPPARQAAPLVNSDPEHNYSNDDPTEDVPKVTKVASNTNSNNSNNPSAHGGARRSRVKRRSTVKKHSRRERKHKTHRKGKGTKRRH